MAKDRAKVMKRRITAVKVETTTGSEVTLSGTDYLEAFNTEIKFDDTFTKRVGDGMGNRRGVPGAQSGSVTLTTELRNSGSATLPLQASALLASAGFKNTGGVFTPWSVTDTGDTVSIGSYQDGRFLSLAGVQFDCKMTGEVGKPVMCEWSGKGKRQIGNTNGPRDVTPITAAPLSGLPPVVKGITLTIGGTAYNFSKFVLNLGNDVQLRPSGTDATGYYAAQIVKCDPSFEIDPEAKSLATKDWYDTYEVGTEVAISIQIGTGTNGTVTIAAAKAQLMKPPETQDGSGIMRDGIFLQLNETATDDWLTITFA